MYVSACISCAGAPLCVEGTKRRARNKTEFAQLVKKHVVTSDEQDIAALPSTGRPGGVKVMWSEVAGEGRLGRRLGGIR